MIKKILLILVLLFIITLIGCNTNNTRPVSNSDTSIPINDNTSTDSFETDVLKSETKYLANKNDEDLKALCSQLSILAWNKKQLREMVLDYYPVFFEKFSEEQIGDISSNGFDPFYEEYVFAYKAEGRGELITIYKEYKEKANNKYSYAMSVYEYVLNLDNLSDDEYAFLYEEAYDLYSEARENAGKVNGTENEIREAFLKVLSAKGCINDISEALGKEIEPNIQKDFLDYTKKA